MDISEAVAVLKSHKLHPRVSETEPNTIMGAMQIIKEDFRGTTIRLARNPFRIYQAGDVWVSSLPEVQLFLAKHFDTLDKAVEYVVKCFSKVKLPLEEKISHLKALNIDAKFIRGDHPAIHGHINSDEAQWFSVYSKGAFFMLIMPNSEKYPKVAMMSDDFDEILNTILKKFG